MAAVRSFAARGRRGRALHTRGLRLPQLLQAAEAARCAREVSASVVAFGGGRAGGGLAAALISKRAQYGCDVEAAGPSHGIPPSLPAPHPRPPHPKVPVDSSFDCLLQVQAYIRWEKVGKPNYPPEMQLVEFEEARKELQAELDKGTSIDQLRKKILKGNIESKVSKQLKNKKYFSVERIQRKSRDIMQLLNKHKPTVIEDQVETAPKQPTVLDLFTKSLQEQDGCKVLCRKLFKFADMEILALATNSLGQTKVYLATNHMEPLILHWALAKKAGEWKAPPSSILPSGSTLLDKACETLFSESELDGLHYQVVEIELDDGGYKGMPFVLRSGETWIKNNGSDFYLDFSTQLTKNIKGTGDAGKGTAKALLERIADLEEDAQRSLMHRFNIATDLVHQARGAGLLGIVGLFVWIIFMASRQLIWNKNYNVKPREISKAQDRFTDDLENMYRTHPQYREILRMIMSAVGRGGEGDVGQRIRDEILVIQRNNDCKGGMMEEWHQKLHNNTCPDDVVICQALIDYIRSDFDISVYWDTLNKNGITKERLLSYDRPIHSEPNFRSEQKEGLLRDLGNYMRSLKASTWKSSLECGLHTSTAAVGELGDIFHCCVFGFEAVQTVPAYRNICFSVDNFNDPFHAVVLSDPEHCYCVILNAHDGAAFPEETESDNNSSNIQSGVNSGSNEEKPQKIQSL